MPPHREAAARRIRRRRPTAAPGLLGLPGLLGRSLVLGLLAALAAACHGPSLHVKNPDGHRLFVDGREVSEETIPFRYYGVTRWDALPNVRVDNGVPHFDHEPASADVEVPVPASRWLFPLDFPIEVASRVLFGAPDQTVEVVVPEKAPEAAFTEIPQEELGRLSARGRAARIAR